MNAPREEPAEVHHRSDAASGPAQGVVHAVAVLVAELVVVVPRERVLVELAPALLGVETADPASSVGVSA